MVRNYSIEFRDGVGVPGMKGFESLNLNMGWEKFNKTDVYIGAADTINTLRVSES